MIWRTGLTQIQQPFFFEDAEKNIWLAGNNGLIKFFNNDVEIVSVSNGLASQYVSSIATSSSRQSIWIAQLMGISCLHNNKVYNFPYPRNERCSWTTIALQGDSLWVGFKTLSLYKMYYIPQPHIELIKEWPLTDGVGHIERYGKSVLVSNSEGLFYIDDKLDLVMLANSPYFFRFLVDKKEVWGGARDGDGIARWEITSAKEKPVLRFLHQFDSAKGHRIHGIAKDRQGNYWFACYGTGVIEMEKQKNDSFSLHHFQVKNGLSSNRVEEILVNQQGQVYAATNRGLSLFHRAGDSLYFEDLSRKYGFVTDVYDLTENNNGDLWLSTPSGAIRIRNDIKRKSVAPGIFITQVLNNNKQDSLFDHRATTALFSHNENNFNFEFSSTSFRSEEQVLYSYQLLKDDDSSEWSLPKKIHNVSIVGLSPGKYTFLVKALSVDNVWSETPAKYSFIITPPYWATWWFRGIAALFLISVVGGIFWFRFRQIKKLSMLRTKISRDLHDEIGSTLSGVSLFSEMAKRQLADNRDKEADQSLDKIITSSDEMLGKMSDIVWAINPRNDSFEKLIARLKIFATTTASQKNILLHFEVQKDLDQYNPDMQRRKNIYLICKEAINNAIKYAECRNLYVGFQRRDHQVSISIRDDGKGFKVEQNFNGNGLLNMQARANEMKADLSVISEKGKGTDVSLMVKII